MKVIESLLLPLKSFLSRENWSGENKTHSAFAGRDRGVCLAIASALGGVLWAAIPIEVSAQTCPSALDRMENYQTAAGDTFESIAAEYRLLPSTISRFNPGVSSRPPAGTSLLLPPFNGSAVSAGAGETWQSLAEQYGSRAEVLFEVNGCAAQVPEIVFIPGGVTVSGGGRSQVSLPGYPLSRPSAIALSYGWQPHSSRDELVFNSGIAFVVDAPADVLAVEGGTVAFAGPREGYGNLVVVNHSGGLQTRYANLAEVGVAVGQPVAADASLGRAGGGEPSYLYFEVRRNSASGWVAEDPGKYLPALELR